MTTQYLFFDVEYDEGCKLKAYRDSRGIWTIGIGHNLQVDPTMSPQLQHLIDTGITEAQARALFNHDVQGVFHGLDLYVPWWRQMNDARQDALVNLTFNIGIGELHHWPHFMGYLKATDYTAASIELANTKPWADQVHDRAKRLAMQFRTGVRQYPMPSATQLALAGA